MAEVRPGSSLNPLKGGVRIMQPERSQRFAIWSQSVFEGDVDQNSVEALIAAERAEAFEGKLSTFGRSELSKHLFDTDQQIMQVGAQYSDEFERAAAHLKERKDAVVIRKHPREKDARWSEVKAMQERMVRREGLVYGSYETPPGWKGKPAEAPLIYVFVAWKEWPILRRYKEKYDLVLYQRVLQTRRWISAEYGKRGMQLFEH